METEEYKEAKLLLDHGAEITLHSLFKMPGVVLRLKVRLDGVDYIQEHVVNSYARTPIGAALGKCAVRMTKEIKLHKQSMKG